jgi:hypothetical protein
VPISAELGNITPIVIVQDSYQAWLAGIPGSQHRDHGDQQQD